MILLLFVTLLANVPRSNPPAIAEIAPQAVEQIQQPPPEQATDFGSGTPTGDGGKRGTGEGAGGGGTTTTAPPASDPSESAIEVGRLKRCVGNPPRQIEDPQSPPCVAYWPEGADNGGSTYKGVSSSEIRIAVPNANVRPEIYGPLFSFFNRRFQFYGRVLKPLNLDPGVGDVAGSQATAKKADEELKVFASLENAAANGGFHYLQELARRKVIGVTPRPLQSESYLKRYDPYLWQYAMATDRIFASTGEWACKRLARQPAAKASGIFPSGKFLSQTKRKFGVILQSDFPDVPVSVDPLVRELKACGEEPVVVQPLDDNSDQRYNDIALEMRGAEVTTILCLCGGTPNAHRLFGAFNSNEYTPELALNSYYLFDDNGQVGAYVGAQNRDQVIGLTFQPLDLGGGKHPADWALEEEGAAVASADAFFYSDIDRFYRQLLLLASGIQMAGPKLTPQTFAQGLQRTVFPNPDTPIMAGKVGFNGGSHSMTIDGAEFWWSNSAVSPYRQSYGPGALCYVDGGKRKKSGSWPEGGNPFTGPCFTGPK